MEIVMRAKFLCCSVKDYGHLKEAELMPVTGGSGENEDFFNFTPAGLLRLSIDKNVAMDYFKPGNEYYLDFTEVIQAPKKEIKPTSEFD